MAPRDALTAAEELLSDDDAPVLSSGERDWLKHNIARLCDWFAAERVAEQTAMLSNDQVLASLVLEYQSAEKAVESVHATRVATLKEIIKSFKRAAS